MASAQVCGPTTSGYGAPAYSGYAPSYQQGYAPTYSGYMPAAPAVEPLGCPLYSNGQWSWSGYSWIWCPPSTITPLGEAALSGYYGTPVGPTAYAPAYSGYTGASSLTGSPVGDLLLGLASLALMPQASQQPYYYGNAPYQGNPYAASYQNYSYGAAYPNYSYGAPQYPNAAYYPGVYGGTNVTNVYRVVRTVRVVHAMNPRFVGRPIRIVTNRVRVGALRGHARFQRRFVATRAIAVRRSFAPQHRFVARRSFAPQHRFVARRSFAPQHRFVARRSFAPRRQPAVRGGRRQRPPHG